MKTTEIKQFAELSEILVSQLVILEASIFEKPLSSDIFLAELNGKKNLLILVAFQDERPCGYKIGFEHSTNTFLVGTAVSYRIAGNVDWEAHL